MSPYRERIVLRETAPWWERVFAIWTGVVTWWRGRNCQKGHDWFVSRRWVFGDDLYPYGIDEFGWDGQCARCGERTETFEPTAYWIHNLVLEEAGNLPLDHPKYPNLSLLKLWESIHPRKRAETIRNFFQGNPYYKKPIGSKTFPRRKDGKFPEVVEFSPFSPTVYREDHRGMRVPFSTLTKVFGRSKPPSLWVRFRSRLSGA